MLASTPIAVVVAFLLNIPLALLLLKLYRRAVLREMQAKGTASQAQAELPVENEAGAQYGAAPPLSMLDGSTPLDVSGAAGSNYSAATQSVRRAAAVTGVAGALFVLVVTIGWHLTLGGRFHFVWFLWWFTAHAWPVPLAVGLVVGAGTRQWLGLAGLYLLILLALSVACLGLYDGLSGTILVSNWLATLLVAIPIGALVYRRIRAVGLLVFAFILVILAVAPNATLALVKLAIALNYAVHEWLLSLSPAENHSWIVIGVVMMLAAVMHPPASTVVTVALMALFALALAAFAGWQILRAVGRAYARKRLSDQSLLLDALWGSVAITHVVTLSSQGGGLGDAWSWLAAPIGAFGAYKLTQYWGLAILCRPPATGCAAPMMVLLRVFSLGKRSERLFDALAPHWLRAGSIVLIAGPDLASGTVQPSHFLEFLARRIRRLFVIDEIDLGRRLSELDLRPDPDGRYRVNQLFCLADTWRGVMRLVARRADCVLMDLRGFSPANQGCEYELEQVLGLVPLKQTVVLVDRTTDRPFLQATLWRLWNAIGPDSPNRRQPSGKLRIFVLQNAESRAIPRIMQLCLGAHPLASNGASATIDDDLGYIQPPTPR